MQHITHIYKISNTINSALRLRRRYSTRVRNRYTLQMQPTWNNGSKSNLDNVNTCRLYFFAKGNSTQKSEVGVGRRRYSTPRYHDASREVFSRRTQQSFQCMNNSHGENQIGATIMSHFQGQRCLLQFYILTMRQWVCAVCAVQSIFLVFVVCNFEHCLNVWILEIEHFSSHTTQPCL